MSERLINVARYRNVPYVVNYDGNGVLKTYRWAGSKNGKYDVQKLPEYVVDFLSMRTSALSNGDLVIEEAEENKEIIENIDYEGNFKDNIHTRTEMEKILNKAVGTMKKELAKITEDAEKRFVIDVAKSMDKIMDNVTKRKALAEFMGIEEDVLFAE